MLSLNKEGRTTKESKVLSKSATKLGQISFINTLPVVLPLQRSAVETDCQMIFGTPQELNQMLSRRELELGAMSSFYFLEDGGFELFPQISISGTGRVGSVLLFSKDDLKNLHGQIIDVPASSATSIKLMQVLLKEEYSVEPVLRLESKAAHASPASKARLLIGDKALAQDDELKSSHLRIDLAQWWFNRFGLPFVFGVWGARKEWARNNQESFKNIASTLQQACKLGLNELLEEVIDEASQRTGLTHDRLNSYYLNELDYRLSDEHTRALELFAKLCSKHGFLQK